MLKGNRSLSLLHLTSVIVVGVLYTSQEKTRRELLVFKEPQIHKSDLFDGMQ